MKASEVVTVVTWALMYAVLGAVLSGVLFGWRDESGGIARYVTGTAALMGIMGVWDGLTRIKKRRRANRAAERVDFPASAPVDQQP